MGLILWTRGRFANGVGRGEALAHVHIQQGPHKETTFAVSLSRIKQSLEVCKYKADLEISIQDVDRSESIPKQLCQDVPEVLKQQ